MQMRVVIPTYNRANQLESLFASLLKQDYPRDQLEVVFVNDGSQDQTQKTLEDFVRRAADQGLSVQALYQDNAGQAAARHLGAQGYGQGVLVFLDDDMELCESDFMHKHAQSHTEPGFVVYGRALPGRQKRYRPPHELMYEWMSERNYREFESGVMPPDGRHFFTANVSICAALYQRSGGFNPRFRHAEDKEFGVRLDHVFGARFMFQGLATAWHNSGTPSFKSFLHRAWLYGGYDDDIAKLYPGYANLNPFRYLKTKSQAPGLLLRAIVEANGLVELLSRPLPLVATFLHKMGATGLATKICKVLFKIHYARGLMTKFPTRQAFLAAYQEYEGYGLDMH